MFPFFPPRAFANKQREDTEDSVFMHFCWCLISQAPAVEFLCFENKQTNKTKYRKIAVCILEMQSSAVTVAFRTEVPINNFPLQTLGVIFAIIDTV